MHLVCINSIADKSLLDVSSIMLVVYVKQTISSTVKQLENYSRRRSAAVAPAVEDSSGERLRGNSGYIPDRGQPQGPSRQRALPGPDSARLCAHPWLGLSPHPTVGMVFPAASHSAPPPPTKYTMAIAWLAPGSNGLLLMSRTNRSHCLFFICQRFNDMDSAPIKAASLKLRPHS